MTPHEVRKKYHMLTRTVLDEEDSNQIERIVDKLDNISEIEELSELIRFEQ